jgi:hypothetical protein
VRRPAASYGGASALIPQRSFVPTAVGIAETRELHGGILVRPEDPIVGGSMAGILFVRIKSGLDAEEFERRLLERRPRFREVRGLVQKIGRDEVTRRVSRDPARADDPRSL